MAPTQSNDVYASEMYGYTLIYNEFDKINCENTIHNVPINIQIILIKLFFFIEHDDLYSFIFYSNTHFKKM